MVRRQRSIGICLGLLILGAGLVPAFAGDSLYGRVTAVKSGSVVVFDYGAGRYDLRLVGIDAPERGPFARQAKRLVTGLVLGKHARMRFEGMERGEMLVRLFTDDPVLGIKDVGVELVKSGLAQRQKGYDYKYGELAAAEAKARSEKKGLWAQAQ